MRKLVLLYDCLFSFKSILVHLVKTMGGDSSKSSSASTTSQFSTNDTTWWFSTSIAFNKTLEYYDYLDGFDPDNMYFEQVNDNLFLHILFRSVIGTILSLSCVFLNATLVIFCLSTEEFRDMKFFPILFQAVVDVIGPGCANIVYEVMTYRKTAEFVQNFDNLYGTVRVLNLQFTLQKTEVKTNLSCFLIYCRSFLNEYSTGPCILATAFIRYVMVCRPTDNILTKKLLLCIAFLISAVTGVSILMNILDMKFSYQFSQFSEIPISREPVFTLNCWASNYRPLWRVVTGSTVFMIIPALASGYFYFSVSKVLLKREQDLERNRTLSIAFCLSWFCWIVCWSPNYWGMSFTNSWREQKFTEYAMSYFIYKYVTLYRRTLQMLYSQINPFLVLILFKPFRETFSDLLCRTIMNRNVKDAATNARNPAKVSENLNNESNKNPSFFGFRNTAALLFVCSITLVITYGVFFTATNFKIEESYELVGNDLGRLRRKSQFQMSRSKDLIPSIQDPDYMCSENHATMSFHYQRCYFLLQHSGIGANLTEQISQCEKREAVLFYPRNVEEWYHVWEFYSQSMGWDPFQHPPFDATLYLHVGLLPTVPGASTFISVDGKIQFSSQTHWWFEDLVDIYGLSITGPKLCLIREYEKALPFCDPGPERKYSICFMDFSPHMSPVSFEYIYTYDYYDYSSEYSSTSSVSEHPSP